MNRLLSLDISSSTIGWAYFEYSDKEAMLCGYGHIKPMSKSKSKDVLPLRILDAQGKLEEIINKYDITEVAVEDYAKRFSRGRSQASTIIILAVFNEMCCLTSYQKTNKNPERYPVATIRKSVGNLFGVKIVSKNDIFPQIVKNCNHFVTVNNRAGNIKAECFDEADAIAVGITAIDRKKITNLKWNL